MNNMDNRTKLYLNGDVHVHRKGRKELVIFSSIPEWIVGEEGIYETIMSLNGKCFSDIDNEQIQELYKSLEEMELLLPEKDIEQVNDLKTEIYPINGMWINVDSNCNLRCKHCFIGETLCESENKLSLIDIQKLAKELKELSTGNLRVVIAGGEPLLRKDIIDIVKAIDDVDGLYPNIITNGLLLTDEIIKFLAERQIETTISLDGTTKEMHEFLRGKNTYEKTMEKIWECKNAGVPLILSMTVHKKNQDTVLDYFDFAEKVGAKRVILNFLNTIGNAKMNNLEPADEFEIIHGLLEKACDDSDVKRRLVNTAVSKLVETVLYPIRTDCCGSGINNCSILANGDVSPCPSFQGSGFIGGNIKEKSLKEIWNNPKTFALHRSVDITNLNAVCSKCEVRLFCGGGCRAQAYYASNGDMKARSPHCKEYKKLYVDLMWLLEENPGLRELKTLQSESLFHERLV